MENQKTKIISIVALVALTLTVVTATYAYFQAQTGEGSQTDIKINANTIDTFTFETGSTINLSLDQTSFASGKGNITGNTYASAKLTANNKTNSATNNYNLYLNISDNNFGYTRNSSYPEILLKIKDASNNEITSISGLEYETVTDGKGASISGFDITTKTGLITLLSNREITTTSTKTDTWNITATFVNYNADQSKNAGKSFSGQVLISKDSFDNYTPNTINTLSAIKSGTNLTVNLNVEQGSNEIDKYYYAIEESNGIAMLNNNANKVQRLSNKLAANTLTYVESTSSSHTFTNLNSSKNYKVSAYVVDKKKLKSNTYEYNYYSDSYVYPTINKVETTATSNSITAVVTATKGTNNISKYYYSVDGGNTFTESTSNTYIFNGLNKNTSYKIVTKVMDTNNKYSNVFVAASKTSSSIALADYVKSLYTGTQGANGLYYHDSSLANGAGDNSYRYAGASSAVNNYICLGSSESICPDANLFRIIGVFGNQVKVIRAKSIGKMAWNNNDSNTWSSASLNTYLKETYLPSLGTLADKIATTTWKVGGNVWDNIGLQTAKAAYKNEVGSNSSALTFVAKIGLIYVSDYMYAVPKDKWTLVGNNYSKVVSVNWIYSYDDSPGWFITPNTFNDYYAYSVFFNYGSSDNGMIMGGFSSDASFVHPAFYLLSSVTYKSGTGSSASDPIRIN